MFSTFTMLQSSIMLQVLQLLKYSTKDNFDCFGLCFFFFFITQVYINSRLSEWVHLCVCILKNFKFKNPNPSIFCEFGGDLPEILQEICQKISWSFWAAVQSMQVTSMNMKNNSEVETVLVGQEMNNRCQFVIFQSCTIIKKVDLHRKLPFVLLP